MFTSSVIVAVLLAGAFLAAGLPKAIGSPDFMKRADHLGVPRGLFRVVGGLEMMGAAGVIVGLWFNWLGFAAGAGLILLMGGAVASHVRVGDPGKAIAAPAILGLVAVAHTALMLVQT